ncbi:hypothetical protein TA3x_004403 [Tundrisphaera sp. TA3]|uniref:hypothetical protein n=1 Tax=Tundrisphaera sp. TA3 TaxID=3435775 RepID=UPI003EBC7919
MASFGFDQTAVVETLDVLETNPPSGSTTSRSISSVTITFDREIDPFTILSGDFSLDRSADPDGSARTISVETAFLDDSDASNRRVSFILNTALPTGQYQIKLSGQSELAGVDGIRATTGEDQILGSFRVESDRLDFGRALNLGTVTGTKVEHRGRLDLITSPGATDLYKFSIPKGREWNLSIDVAAQRDGNSLDAVAILYDAQGKEVVNIERGKIDSPLDPSLTLSLAGGEYFIAVAGRLMGKSTDGSYRLQLSAAPSASRTTVVGIRGMKANPNTSELTGLAIDFSGPIDLNSLLIDPSRVLSLVDGQGQSWPISLASVSTDHTTLTFVLGAALPVGSYQIKLGSDSMLADLSGRTPSRPGLAAGVLGSIDVVSQAAPSASDLGTLWSAPGSKVGGVVSLADGMASSRTFTLLADGTVSLVAIGERMSARFSILDADGRPMPSILTFASEGSGPGEIHWNYILKAGTYTLTIDADEPVAAAFGVSLVFKSNPASNLLDSGVGQGPPSGPKVISPASGSGGVATPRSPAGERGGPGLSPDRGTKGNAPIVEPLAGDLADYGPHPGIVDATMVVTSPAGSDQASPLSSPMAHVSPGENAGATILIGGVPAGYPETTFDIINVVGPAPGAGSVSLASNHPTLPHGLLQEVAESLIADSNVVGESPGLIWGRPAPARRNGPTVAPKEDAPGEASGAMPDLAKLDMNIDLGWFTRVAGWVEDHLIDELPPAIDPDVPEGAIAIGTGSPEAEMASRIDSASLASPALLIGTILAAYRTRVEIRKRARRSKEGVEQARTASRKVLRPKCRWGRA